MQKCTTFVDLDDKFCKMNIYTYLLSTIGLGTAENELSDVSLKFNDLGAAVLNSGHLLRDLSDYVAIERMKLHLAGRLSRRRRIHPVGSRAAKPAGTVDVFYTELDIANLVDA